MRSVSETLAIRRMTREDVEWAQRLSEGSPQAPRWPASAYLAAIDPEATPKRIALVAETPITVPRLSRFGGRIAPKVGFTVASIVPPQAELETIVVAPAARRNGVGVALMRAMIEELKTPGATEVTLEVRASNRPALALYRSLGFLEVGRRSGYYVDPIEDAALMRLDLG
jgi:[ribosomal protein S18]-alanine N-acetyltransferase